MAKRVAQFYKVSFEQFREGAADAFGVTEEQITEKRGSWEL